MFKVAKIPTGEFIIVNYDPAPETGRPITMLRFGHEVQRDGIGLGKVMRWKFADAAKMYADLLNRGIRL